MPARGAVLYFRMFRSFLLFLRPGGVCVCVRFFLRLFRLCVPLFKFNAHAKGKGVGLALFSINESKLFCFAFGELVKCSSAMSVFLTCFL